MKSKEYQNGFKIGLISGLLGGIFASYIFALALIGINTL